jgi:four helix bundle protein
MAGWKDFRDIAAWQRAEELKLRVYAFLNRPNVRRRFDFCDDMARAARSGPSNIAEGFGRFGNREFAKFARISKASQVEVLNHFIDARDQRLLTRDEFLIEEHYARIALKTTVGLIRHLESSEDPPRPPKIPRSKDDDENR